MVKGDRDLINFIVANLMRERHGIIGDEYR